ncbi:hypothetical protein [Streptomyces sp. ISL-12]|uniref:hypothetical protein n=1 Tax=Streptomyces sp. ISL-12 TaxID=2819177 RepID=UPI002035D264|nr:hypothetical protein [Streptomyces sp. ISL-12]
MSDNGTEVGVDVAADGSAVVDLWRLRWYGLSLPEPLDVPDDVMRSVMRSAARSLRSAARSLRSAPRTEVRPGWFSVAG